MRVRDRGEHERDILASMGLKKQRRPDSGTLELLGFMLVSLCDVVLFASPAPGEALLTHNALCQHLPVMGLLLRML